MLKRSGWRAIDHPVYLLVCAAATLGSLRAFYGSMMKQTGGEWSAPLDDVFIHFDYARSIAEGHPFEWVPGNGYSSGNTSLSYPFLLAIGYLAGFEAQALMKWAAVLAGVCVFGLLLAARPLFVRGPHDTWGRAASFLLPPIFLGVGALDWSLWSGMEVALFLGTWALALRAYLWLEDATPLGSEARATIRHRAWLLGLAGACMILTRPEGVTTIAVFGIAAALGLRSGWRPRLGLAARVAIPGVLVTAAQAVSNRALTGEWSANGAIVKLAVHSPFLTRDEKSTDWIENLRYAALRNLEYHFADATGDLTEPLDRSRSALHDLAWRFSHDRGWGVALLALACLPLAFPGARKIAWVLAAQIASWGALVALNGQVRWQNERYVMPAVAWLLVLAALGVGEAFRRARPSLPVALAMGAILAQVYGVVTRPADTPPVFRLSWTFALEVAAAGAVVLSVLPARAVATVLALLFAYDHQASKMRDQRWFFGRASRNIRDQHVTMGRWLARQKPRRVLVGDAGAIIYASHAPGLDIIGLGGYRGMPFARASVHGLPATMELIERIPPADRPDVLAIFPTWWGVLPIWFGAQVLERFPVEGNVICGGYEHVAYRADFSLLGSGATLRAMPRGDHHVRDEVDVADLVSEGAHGYAFPRPAGGWTDMRILGDPSHPYKDLFDAGRRIAQGRAERFHVGNVVAGRPAHLVFRTAPEGASRIVIRAGRVEAHASFARTEAWVEEAVELPAEAIADAVERAGRLDVEVTNEGPSDFVDYHVWLTQP